MAHFFTRLADRSLGLSPVVQPAIAPRFGSAPAEEAALNQPQPMEQQTTANHAGRPSNTPPTPSPPPVVPTQQMPLQLDPQPSSPGPTRAERPVQVPIQPVSSESSPAILPSESRVPPQIKDRVIDQERPQPDAVAPFRVLGQPEPHPLADHSWPSTALPSDEISIVAARDVPRAASSPDYPQPAIGVTIGEGDFSLEKLRQHPLEPIPGLHSQEDLRLSSSPAPQAPLHFTLPSQVSPVAAEPPPPPPPPTIRVSIGRVEVRAILPSPPATKPSPVRPRPAVSLNDYLKQRRGKS